MLTHFANPLTSANNQNGFRYAAGAVSISEFSLLAVG